jgi:hypothetical protein
MALKSTIFKIDLQIADMDRGYYADHALTIARHPSETDERMMARVLAFALFAAEDLSFGNGLSTNDEPDLWRRDLTGEVLLWVDVGQPDEKLIRKACHRARQVVVWRTCGGRKTATSSSACPSCVCCTSKPNTSRPWRPWWSAPCACSAPSRMGTSGWGMRRRRWNSPSRSGSPGPELYWATYLPGL